jgi:hypothetical protein
MPKLQTRALAKGVVSGSVQQYAGSWPISRPKPLKNLRVTVL